MTRDCKNCIRNIPGTGCTSWECEPITRGDAVKAFELWEEYRDQIEEIIRKVPSADVVDSGYIKREDAINIFDGNSEYHADTIADMLLDIPSSDVVAVVRCKDCKWYEQRTENTRICGWHNTVGYKLAVAFNDYCSMANQDSESDDMRGAE